MQHRVRLQTSLLRLPREFFHRNLIQTDLRGRCEHCLNIAFGSCKMYFKYFQSCVSYSPIIQVIYYYTAAAKKFEESAS